jgi:S1-C subfamily serine protease
MTSTLIRILAAVCWLVAPWSAWTVSADTTPTPDTRKHRAGNAVGINEIAQNQVADTVPSRQLPSAAQQQSESTATSTDSRVSGEMDLAALKRRFQNAVVKVEFTSVENRADTKLNPTKSEQYYADEASVPHGSGFFISESEIVTNAHVVEEARHGSIRVRTPATGNLEFRAEVVGVGGSETIDLAVLRLPDDEMARLKKWSGVNRITTLEFGNSDEVKQADSLAIFGYPQQSDDLKIIQAKVTGRQYLKIDKGRFVCGHHYIEVGPSGVVQRGNSGGPALDRSGRVVGIPARGSYSSGWLIPSNLVLEFLERVRQSDRGRKSLRLSQLGVELAMNSIGTAVMSGAPEDCVIFELGVLVREVTSNTLAEKWGIQAGDLIVGFANKQRGLSCALDFQGYRVTSGRMRTWPPQEGSDGAEDSTSEPLKLHLTEMILTSQPGDDVSLWLVRRGVEGIQRLDKKFEYMEPCNIPHLGAFEKPEFELWGDFVAQDFNSFNRALFEVPLREVNAGGVLVTFSEPNSLATRSGISVKPRSVWGFSFTGEYEPSTSWVIIDSVNGQPVKSLAELKAALRAAEKRFDDITKSPGFDPAKRMLLRERYVEIGFRTNTYSGDVIRMKPAFPIDEALECKAQAAIKVE